MPRLSIFAVLLFGLPIPLFAQGDALTELYGEGVHRFYAGDYVGAEQAFTRVVESGSQDPRAYYYRGLTQEMLGGDGSADFEAGANMEVRGRRVVDVGAALIRVQGFLRAEIEQARRDARIAARQEALSRQQEQPEPESTPRVTPFPEPPEPEAPAPEPELTPVPENEDAPPTSPVPDPTSPVPDIDESDPFSTDGLRAESTRVDPEQPTAPAADALTDPFGDDPTPAVTPEPVPEADPFGAPPADDGGTADPFGTPPADDGGAADPFGGAPPAEDSGADPFADPLDGPDPQGGAMEPTEVDPADNADPAVADPFSGAGEPAEADPFDGLGEPTGEQPGVEGGGEEASGAESEADPADDTAEGDDADPFGL